MPSSPASTSSSPLVEEISIQAQQQRTPRKHHHSSTGTTPHAVRDNSPVASPSRRHFKSLRVPEGASGMMPGGDEVRRSICDPDFLADVAKNGTQAQFDKDGKRKFNVVTGDEAANIYRSFLQDEVTEASKGDTGAQAPDGKHSKLQGGKPVVFAFTAQDAGRKVVDYYMTWRGKTPKTNHLKGTHRRLGFLDSEFKKVAKTLDQEFKRRTRADGSDQEDPSSSTRPTPLHSSHSSPAALEPSSLDSDREDTLTPTQRVELDRRPSVASVQSLPYLGAVRGVPLGNRMPLRVLNPDPSTPSTITSFHRDRNSGYFAKEDGIPEEDLVTPRLDIPDPVASLNTIPEVVVAPAKESISKGHVSDSTSSSHHGSPTGLSQDHTEFQVVVLDEDSVKEVAKKLVAWNDLPSRSAPPMSSRKPSQRASPWDGTAAHSSSSGGEIRRYPSQHRDHRTRTHSHPRFRPGTSTSDSSPYTTSDEQSDSSSSEGGSGWKDKPVVPVIVPSLQWMLRNGHLKPEDVVPKHLGRNGGNGWLGGLARSMSLNSHGGSPYASSPYGSPTPSNVSLPAGYYGATPYSSPYMPAGSVGSVYASPYISQAQSLPPMQSMAPYGYTAWAPPDRQGSPTPGAYGASAVGGGVGAGVPRVPSWHAGVSYGSPYMGQPQMQY